MAPRFYRDDEGHFHQRIYGIDIESLDIMYGGIRPKRHARRAWDWHAPWACRWSACSPPTTASASPSSTRRRGRWTDASASRSTPTTRCRRAVLFPTFMLAGGTLLPHVAPARVPGLQRLDPRRLLRRLRRPADSRVAALPVIDTDAAVAEVKRVAERGFQAVFIRTNPVHGKKYSDPSFDPLWQAIVDTGMKLGLHPLPMWDQDGTSKGYRLPDIMAASCLGFPMDMIHTLYDMMAGGVFDRFPTMPTMILEAGVGWMPSMFERFEEHRKMFGKIKAPEWKTPPMEIFERQMMVTVEACEETDLKIALDFLPADHVALASDWPHYDGTPDLLAGYQKASGRRRHRCSRRRDARDGDVRALVPVALSAMTVR